MNALILLLFANSFVYWKIIILGETVFHREQFFVEVFLFCYENLQVVFRY